MSGNRDLILAGVGSGNALAAFAAKGTVMPTTAIAALGAPFKDPGWVNEDGLKKAVDQATNEIKGYGTTQPLRTLTTSKKTTFEITFLETNPVVLAVYNKLALNDADLVPDASGAFDFTEGAARTIEYAAVFDVIDGLNHIRAVVPQCEVTDTKEYSVKAGEAIQYGVTLTAYPGSDGVAIHWFYVLDALKTP